MTTHPTNPLVTDEWCYVTDAADVATLGAHHAHTGRVHRASCTRLNRRTILRRVTATDIEHIGCRCLNCGGGS